VKDILKEQSQLLDSHKNDLLFGDSFDEKLTKESNTLTKSKKVFTGLNKSSSTSSRGHQQPFRTGSLPRNNSWTKGGRGQSSHGSFSRAAQRGQRGKKNKLSSSEYCEISSKQFVKFEPIFKGSHSHKEHFPFKCESSTSIGGETKLLHKELGENNSGSKYSAASKGVSNSISETPKTGQTSSKKLLELGGTKINRSRGSEDASERCHSGSTFDTRSISKLYFSSTKEGIRLPSSNKSKISESLYSLSTFQNGRVTLSEGSSPKRGPYVQTGSERCLLFGSSPSKNLCVFSGKRKFTNFFA